MGIVRLWNTVRWLKPVQVYGRLWFQIYRPRPDLSSPPTVRRVTGTWAGCPRPPSMTGPLTFRFLGVERRVACADDWNRADWPKLWLYNSHYFDDLAANDAGARAQWHRSLISRWIAENPPGQGNGWEPYPSSLRIVNWVKWALAGGTLEPEALHSLAVQVRYLRQRLEVHLQGNHLWANLKALLVAGLFFEGAEPEEWRSFALRMLRRELPEQVLGDGGHFERSPMYHAIALEDLLDLVQLARIYDGVLPADDVAAWRHAVERMLGWLRAMTHPDGGIGFFNDATHGVAPEFAALEQYAARLQVSLPSPSPTEAPVVMGDTGYVRLEAGPAVLLADVGDIGPDYIPGHAHADTLSFELSLHGRRIVVNAGISTYDACGERLRQRGTASHSTVQLGRHDSSEVWSSFRVARRARPRDVAWHAEPGALVLTGAHDGYRRLPGQPIHRRSWRLGRRGLTVLDRIEGGHSRATARFLLHPDWRVAIDSSSSGQIGRGGQIVRWMSEGCVAMRVAEGAWHPSFGVSVPCQVMEIDFLDRLQTQFVWE